jgi:predicted N-acetyltransferase YhbS
MPNELVIRDARTREDITALHLLRMIEAKECAPVPVDPKAVASKLMTARENEADHFMLMAVLDGELVGHLCIERASYWYAPDQDFLCDFGFFVLPQHRSSGRVGVALLNEAKEIAEMAGLPLVVCINNPNRRRGTGSREEKLASLLRYVPAGSIFHFKKD